MEWGDTSESPDGFSNDIYDAGSLQFCYPHSVTIRHDFIVCHILRVCWERKKIEHYRPVIYCLHRKLDK